MTSLTRAGDGSHEAGSATSAGAVGLGENTGTRDALLLVAGFSARQGAISGAIIAALVALAWQLDQPEWIGLFGLLLAPLMLVALAANAGARLLPATTSWTAGWCLLVGLVALAAVLSVPAYQHWMGSVSQHALGANQVIATAGLSGLLALGVPLWQVQSQWTALRLSTLERAAVTAELKALQAQIEPHFLYNTLANTRYLARHDPDKAVQMLDHLIAYLHSALPDMRSTGSTLGREFELAEHYLALMAIRFGERLSFEVDYPAALRGASMPPLMLMSLVENAVQHGVEPMPGKVRVRLQAAQHDGVLRIVVSDDGAGASTNAFGSGFGLRNLRARLQAQFNGAASFTLRIEEGRATEAELLLPMEHAAGSNT